MDRPADEYGTRLRQRVLNSPGSGVRLQLEPMFTWEQCVCILQKNRTFVLVFAGFLTLGIAILVFQMRDTYRPIARLEIDPPGTGIKTLQEIDDSRASDNQDYLETQVQVLQSDSLAVSVMRALKLDHNPEFVPSREIADWDRAQKNDKHAKPLPAGDRALLQEHFDLAERSPLESRVLEAFRKRLAVNVIRNTRLVEVSFESHDPALAQLVTNALVTQFIDQNHRNRYTSTMEASEWLSAQLDDLQRKVEESNQAVADYQKRYGLIELDDHDVPLGQLMNEVSRQLSDAQANRIEAEAYVRMLDTGQSEELPILRDDQLYQNLMERYADARAQLTQARAVYGDENSNVKKLQDETTEFAAQVEAERQRMAARLRTSLAAAKTRERMMLHSRERLRAQMGDASSHLVEYRTLKNEAIANAELYNTLQARLKEAGIYAGLGSDNIHIVDLAPRLWNKTSPHRQLILAMGAIISCVFAVVFAFVRESLDNTIRTPDDIKDWVGLSSLAMIPRVHQNGRSQTWRRPPKQELVALVDSPAERRAAPNLYVQYGLMETEAIRELRTSLMLWKQEAEPRVILVSSPSSREGKSTVAVNLAVSLAQKGTTCLIEGDLRRPTLERTFGLGAKTGLSKVLGDGCTLEDALVPVPGLTNLRIVPSGPRVANPADLVTSDGMRSVVATLRGRFDRIVIDSPPVLPFADARYLSSLADAVILVGRYRLTTRRAVTRCAELLDEVRAPILGVVLNDMDLGSADYHYYNYGYSRRRRSDYHGYSLRDADATSEPRETDVGKDIKKKGAHA